MSGRVAAVLFARKSHFVAALPKNLHINEIMANGVLPHKSIAMCRLYGSETSAEKTKVAQTEAAPPNTGKVEAVDKLAHEVEHITKELNELKAKNDDILDKYKRALADGENLRVRLTKQIADAKVFGIQSFCKDLLEVADTLGHATAAVPKDAVNDKNPHLKSLFEGLNMTQASLMQVFKRHGLEPMDPINQKFNPNFHEALFQKVDTTVEPNTVVEVTKLGYKLHERCIRPALVGVSKQS
ncbi:grpE protein homolog, mitochondrial-like [Teleopsis dalmanni]|uniref:grpE protein homolog, mitochondrial-like n=1 Tax=Teleopsis dalmanni TaxID=139649 RepID=UPI0018CDBA0A|nr:grpE protein homolog, mitochondrial-like [Teleopsis dalmanni]XP_037947424.1 grpE protein homolog, mitochondrial-like [Teleopsis dalmanni]XP_037949708.1 grpE protein homolog, mitochondrial-like [Teleopsis dalmanni]